MVAIVGLKTTTDSERYSRGYFMEEAKEQLYRYFTIDENWKDKLVGVKYGIPVRLLIEDCDKIFDSFFSEGIRFEIGRGENIIVNPNFKP